MKSGWQTSEFWLVLVTAVLSVVVAAGFLTPEQSVQINDSLAQIIKAVADLVTVLGPIVGTVAYVWSRTKVKTNGK
jgi:hypothetical protein